MRIALQFSGRLRYTEHSLNTIIQNIIHITQPDIFCSFWNPEKYSTELNWNHHILSTAIEYEDQKNIKPILDEIFPFNIHQNMPSMSYKFYKVSQLRQQYEKESGIKYDVVIQARADSIIFEQLSIPNNIDGIWCSNRTYSSEIDPYISPRMVDNFYLGDYKSINLASDTFWYLRYEIQQYLKSNNHHHIRIPEIIQSKIWNDLGIKIYSLNGNNPAGDFWYDIERGDTPYK